MRWWQRGERGTGGAGAAARASSMFMQPMPAGGGNGGGVSRPFFVGLVLLLLFLSMQTDWSPQGAARGPLHGKLGAPSAAEVREGAKDQVRGGAPRPGPRVSGTPVWSAGPVTSLLGSLGLCAVRGMAYG